MARESQLWTWLAKGRLHFKLRLHMHRVENPVSPGMPDVEGHLGIEAFAHHRNRAAIAHGQFWIELKSAKRPIRKTTPIRFKMRPKQVEWARRRWNIGGSVYWLLQVGDGGSRCVYMLRGSFGAALAAGMTEDAIRANDVLCHYFEPKPTPEIVITAAVSRA